MTPTTFTIPLRALGPSPNRRQHWAVRAAMSRDARSTTALYARGAGIPVATTPRAVRIEVCWSNRKRRFDDVDNCTTQCKAILDGLVEAGVLVDDSPRWLTSCAPTQSRGKSPFVVVTVTVADTLADLTITGNGL